MLKASDIKPYVVFITPPSYDRILTLRRGKVDPFNPRPTAPMTVSVTHTHNNYTHVDDGFEVDSSVTQLNYFVVTTAAK